MALIDAQPGAGNITLPPRARLGATSTLLTQYLQTADLEPPLSLATALFYGIKTITMGLSRDTSPAVAAAYIPTFSPGLTMC